MFVSKILLVVLPCFVGCFKPGPHGMATKGEMWPKPQNQFRTTSYYVLERTGAFDVMKPFHTCDILDKGVIRLLRANVDRRLKLIQKNLTPIHYDERFRGYYGVDTRFRIELSKECENYPHLHMDEEYELSVGASIVLSSSSVWGILRGLQTFNQLLYFTDDFSEIRINVTTVSDHPAYTHRGLLIDTGRQFLRPETIHVIIEAMEMNKMNVLHWHMVDDESFPYQSETLPDLSEKGAFHPSMVYTKHVVQDIIERARLAGIRVIPEFDAPGHVRSWGYAYPDILTECYDEFSEVVALGPLNPISNTTHVILKALYDEVTDLFKDEYVHIGGDEIDTKCWLSNLKIHAFKKLHRICNIVRVLLEEFLNAVKAMLPPTTKYILWQDVFDADIRLPSTTIVQVWRTQSEGGLDPAQEMVKVLNSGHQVIFSSSWYLDKLGDTWETFYRVDPRSMVASEAGARGNVSVDKLQDIVGGEACMWGEMVDESNIFSRIWPRASAVAERLWTGAATTSSLIKTTSLLVNSTPLPRNATEQTRRRMEEHACRMRQNDVPAEPPNGPGFCIGPGLL